MAFLIYLVNFGLCIVALVVIFNHHFAPSTVPVIKIPTKSTYVLSPTKDAIPSSRDGDNAGDSAVALDPAVKPIHSAALVPIVKDVTPQHTKTSSTTVATDVPMSWQDFVELEPPKLEEPNDSFTGALKKLNLRVCSASKVSGLSAPMLSEKDFEWCKWAVSPQGGRVQVGKSYGKLQGKDRSRFEQLDCNSASAGINPSCDDSWGDIRINKWKTTAHDICKGEDSSYTSKMQCMDSSSNSRFCVMEHAMLDFNKMHDVKRPGRSTGSRRWDSGFLTNHCEKETGQAFHKYYLPSEQPSVPATVCDHVFLDPVLAFGHDDIMNLGHSMNDVMNVWVMLWLSGLGGHSKNITFFNIDALRQGHNYHDKLATIGDHYYKGFKEVVKAKDYASKKGSSKVCFKTLLFPSLPLMMFTWDGWWTDMPCTFKGPSSLFQRWNLQVRNNYALLDPSRTPTNTRIQVLLILRRTKKGADHMYTSRIFTDEKAIIDGLQSHLSSSMLRQGSFEGEGQIEFVAVDLATLDLEKQVELMSSSSIVVGMHGAGIPNTMHMPVGSRLCCGVIEIFPSGEFKDIRGYGNMARRMGHVYNAIYLAGSNDMGQAFIAALTNTVSRVITAIRHPDTASCVLPTVISDPYFRGSS